MKNLLAACFAAALLGFATAALASPTIELKDGSRIQGEIQRVENGVYTVLSPSLGTVLVAQSNIARIVYDGEAGAPREPSARDAATSREIQALQAHLVQDPEAMKSIMSLQSDPQIQAILNDPSIVQALQDGDYKSLLDNPRIKALENNAQLKELLRQQDPH